MSELQLVLAQLTKLGVIALFLGMIWRSRVGLCWSFTFYLGVIILGNGLVTMAPDTFYTGWFFVLKQGAYDILKMAIALELAWRAFSAFPGAWRVARIVLAALLAVSTLTLAWLTPHSSYRTLTEWQPSVVTATVWLFTAVALLVVHYQIPIGDWQRRILMGFVVYLFVFITVLNLLGRRGWQREELGIFDSVNYLLLLLFWIHAAWRHETQDAVPVASPA
jgi:hypothetical protein